MNLRPFDILCGLVFGLFACWFVNGFFHGDPALHNVELVSNYFTRAIQLAIYLAAAALLVTALYVYWLWRTKLFAWRKIGFPLAAILVGLFIVYVPISYLYERTLMVRERIHPFIQMFPEAVPVELANRPPDEKVIVCLGGSTTAWGDAKFRKWTQLLEQNLNDAGHSVRVLNQGRPWFTSMHSLYNYQTNVRLVRPDIVIVMHAINDLTMNADHSYFCSGEFRRDYGHALGPFARLSRTQPLFDLTIEVARRSWYVPKRQPIDTDVFPGLETFASNLRSIVRMAQADGATVVLMTQGSLYKDTMPSHEAEKLYVTNRNAVGDKGHWSIGTALNGMRQYNATTCRLSKDLDVVLIDLDQKLPKTLEYFNDDCHYRGAAIDLIAESVTETVDGLWTVEE